ncbi:MAG: type II toxin-antitoxin system VapC family toxin [Verrucomicrobiia bacterium]
MICVDSTFLVDLWRAAGRENAGCIRLLRERAGETFAVPAHAAGEFLEGGAVISAERFGESLRFLRLFTVGQVGLGTAEHYARAVADLRSRQALGGMSKPDLWIAAWALEHGCPLATRNMKHFEPIRRLELIGY